MRAKKENGQKRQVPKWNKSESVNETAPEIKQIVSDKFNTKEADQMWIEKRDKNKQKDSKEKNSIKK